MNFGYDFMSILINLFNYLINLTIFIKLVTIIFQISSLASIFGNYPTSTLFGLTNNAFPGVEKK